MADVLVTPPVRSPLMEDDGKLTASRNWWLYFNQLTGQTNANGQMVSYGASSAIPDAGSMPDGAIYIESDRSGVIYQNQGGAWHYLAGTMWGTLSPDERPTDLGPNDAGFTYRGTDQAREFIWSGTAWVETGDIVENSGSPLPVRGVLNFTGAGVTAADDTVNLRTNITIPGGGTGGGAVSSVFGRTGAVTAQTGDYIAYQVTNAVDSTVNYANPPWIFSLAWNKIIGVPVNTKGDLLTYSTAAARLAVGADGQVLTADSTQVTGLRWVAPGSAPVASVFGRTGAVVAASGDYTAAQVTNAVDSTATYANPAWITSLPWSKITGTPSVSSYQTPWLSDIAAAGFRLLNTGNVGIGTSSPAGPLEVHATTNENLLVSAAVQVTGSICLQAVNDADTANVPMELRASLFSFIGGNLGIGMVNPTHQLELGSDSAAKPSTNTWTISSDLRLKENVAPLEGGLEIINRLEPIVARYNGKAGTPANGRVVSLDPAKLRGILPHAVSSRRAKLDPADREETDILGVNTHEILYHLVLAVQQLAKKP